MKEHEEKIRPWSKHSKGSSKYQEKVEKKKLKFESKLAKQTKELKEKTDVPIDKEFKDFLETTNKKKEKVWSNNAGDGFEDIINENQKIDQENDKETDQENDKENENDNENVKGKNEEMTDFDYLKSKIVNKWVLSKNEEDIMETGRIFVRFFLKI
jgi:hypothetical protein